MSNSNSPLSKDNPSMIVRALTPSVTIFSFPFARGPLPFGLRCTAVRLRTGSIVVISPCSLTPKVLSILSSLSPSPTDPNTPNIRYLIAPDIEHHIHLTAWKSYFPNAQILAPEGLFEKRKSQGRDQPSWGAYAHTWTAKDKRTEVGKFGTLPAEFKDEFDVEYFHPHPNKDVAFLHRPDGGTLIEADLFFNLPCNEQYSGSSESSTSGLFAKITNFMLSGPKTLPQGGVTAANAQQRIHWWLMAASDRKEYAKSVKVVSEWQFERIVPCHGDVVEDKANEKWAELFKWFMDMKV